MRWTCHHTDSIQGWKETCPTWSSGLKPLFGMTWWWSSFAALAGPTIGLKSVFPGLTTQLSCWSWPIRKTSSLIAPNDQPIHHLISLWSYCNFSSERCRVTDSEPNLIPRTVSLHVRLSLMWCTIEIPSLEHNHSSAIVDSLNTGSPVDRKLSK